MILSPMFKFHLLVPAARADRGETGENRPVPGSGRGSGPLGHWAERERGRVVRDREHRLGQHSQSRRTLHTINTQQQDSRDLNGRSVGTL